jgi:hypothetical protein
MAYISGNYLDLEKRLHQYSISGGDLTAYLNEGLFYLTVNNYVNTGISNGGTTGNLFSNDLIARFNKEYILKSYSVLGQIITGNLISLIPF